MHVSSSGRAFIGAQEGLRLRAYRDAAGNLTIGRGHTSMAGPPRVVPGMVITRAQADQILARDLLRYEEQVLREVHVALSQCQFDALADFTYNCGDGSLRKLVELSNLNSGDASRVPHELLQFNKASGRVLPVLVRRRKAEAAMFDGRYPAFLMLAAASALNTLRSLVAPMAMSRGVSSKMEP